MYSRSMQFPLKTTNPLSFWPFLFTQDLEYFAVGQSRDPVSAQHPIVVRGVEIMAESADGPPAVADNEVPGALRGGK